MYKTKGIPHPTMNRKDWVEKHINGRRNKEEESRQQWDSTAKYFKTCEVKTSKYAHLSSPEIYQQSMEAYNRQLLKEEQDKNYDIKNSRLHANSELRDDFAKRREQYDKCPIISVQSVQDGPTLVLPKIDRRYLEADSTPTNEIVMKHAETSNLSPCQLLLNSKTEDNRISELKQPEPRLPIEETLRAMQQSERAAASLKQEHADLWNYLHRLRDKYRQRSVLLQDQHGISWRNNWVRPYKVQIQLRGRCILEALQLDIQMLSMVQAIMKRIENDEGFCEKVEKIKMNLIHEHVREKERLWGVENLFQEEAERFWFLQSAEWENEEKERNKLVEQCVKLVESKLQIRISENLELQQSNIREREQLLTQLP